MEANAIQLRLSCLLIKVSFQRFKAWIVPYMRVRFSLREKLCQSDEFDEAEIRPVTVVRAEVCWIGQGPTEQRKAKLDAYCFPGGIVIRWDDNGALIACTLRRASIGIGMLVRSLL